MLANVGNEPNLFIGTVRNLRISSNVSPNNEEGIADRHPPLAPVEGFAEKSQMNRRRSERRRLIPRQLQSTVLGPSKRTGEALLLSSSSHGSGLFFFPITQKEDKLMLHFEMSVYNTSSEHILVLGGSVFFCTVFRLNIMAFTL